MRIVDNLYARVWRGSDNNCNTYIFAGVLSNGGHVIIDPGHDTTPFYQESGLDSLMKDMAGDGIAGKDVRLVILTHAHPDHCEAAEVLREQNGAIVALHKADEATYRSFGGKVDLYLEEGDLVFGEENPVRLKVYHSPGHSPGHVTIYWPAQKVLVAGDVLFYHSTGRVDLPGGSGGLLRESVERLSELEIEYLLCGHPYGHPGVITGKQAVQENFDFIKRNVLL